MSGGSLRSKRPGGDEAGGLGASTEYPLSLGQCPPSSSRALSTSGSLDNRSPISSKPAAFFSELQEFRESNREECMHREPE